jgi:hypothetical protein
MRCIAPLHLRDQLRLDLRALGQWPFPLHLLPPDFSVVAFLFEADTHLHLRYASFSRLRGASVYPFSSGNFSHQSFFTHEFHWTVLPHKLRPLGLVGAEQWPPQTKWAREQRGEWVIPYKIGSLASQPLCDVAPERPIEITAADREFIDLAPVLVLQLLYHQPLCALPAIDDDGQTDIRNAKSEESEQSRHVTQMIHHWPDLNWKLSFLRFEQ